MCYSEFKFNIMNVKELIEELEKFPQSAKVTYYHDYNNRNIEITSLRYHAEKDKDSFVDNNNENQVVLNDW